MQPEPQQKKIIHREPDAHELKKFEHKIVEKLQIIQLENEVKRLKGQLQYKQDQANHEVKVDERVTYFRHMVNELEIKLADRNEELALLKLDLTKKQWSDKVDALHKKLSICTKSLANLEKKNQELLMKYLQLKAKYETL